MSKQEGQTQASETKQIASTHAYLNIRFVLIAYLAKDKHISNYGIGNERRLTGKHDTAAMSDFSWGAPEKSLQCVAVHQPFRKLKHVLIST